MSEQDRERDVFERAFTNEAESFEPRALDAGLIARRARGAGRSRALLAAAAVLAVTAGTAGGVTWLRDGSGGEEAPDRIDASVGETPTDELAAGWRYESFRDVQVQVPSAWDHRPSPASDWCAYVRGDVDLPVTPYVDSRNGYFSVLAIGCPDRPAPDLHGFGVPKEYWAPHVSFAPVEQPDGPADGTTTDGGWTRIVRTVGAARVSVLADEKHLAEARRIIDSATITQVDANGCPATSEIQADRFLRPEPAFDVREVASVDSIAVCQYELGSGIDHPGKLASRVISGDAAQNLLLAAIKESPAGGGPDTPNTCAHEFTEGTAIVLRLRSGGVVHDMYVYYESCINNGFDDGTTKRALTLASCEPLWGGRVLSTSGSSAPFRACHGGVGGGGKK